MNFKLNFGSKVKEAWVFYKNNVWNFILLMFVVFAVSYFASDHGFLVSIVANLLSVFITYIWFKSIFNMLEGKEFMPFSKESFPDLLKYWNLLKTTILIALTFLGGFILLIVPGFYFMGRLLFAVYISIEEPEKGARYAVKKSWEMTRGNGWRLFGYSFLIGLFTVLGFVALFIGVFVTYPLGMMILVMVYRDFKKFKEGNFVKEAEIIKEESKKEEVVVEEAKIEVKQEGEQNSPQIN
ncbi:TPA: hypothetical protein DIC38_01535 [Candidatus Nomurabacteria bacterium]|nr:MAG: hypothetical protein O210_OD1C00001G0425 [Parcubacteria bacterium RAAC4_OD1_1]HCY26343.1 hypothetical protein [Candidatus Nomurabacteria bacterium]